MKDYFLLPTDYEKILHFTSDIISIRENLRPSIQQKLDDYFGYESTILWSTDNEGNLSDPLPYKFSDKALNSYITEYSDYDLLHPNKNLSLFKQYKALRLVDIAAESDIENSIFYRHFLTPFHLHDEMVIALTYQESLIGILGMGRKNDVHKYSLRDQKILQLLSNIIASTISHEVKQNNNQLSQRELEIVKLLKNGWPNHKIADELYISVNTVKKHLQSIYRKYNVQNKIQLVQKV